MRTFSPHWSPTRSLLQASRYRERSWGRTDLFGKAKTSKQGTGGRGRRRERTVSLWSSVQIQIPESMMLTTGTLRTIATLLLCPKIHWKPRWWALTAWNSAFVMDKLGTRELTDCRNLVLPWRPHQAASSKASDGPLNILAGELLELAGIAPWCQWHFQSASDRTWARVEKEPNANQIRMSSTLPALMLFISSYLILLA